jgi:hypothetical protein
LDDLGARHNYQPSSSATAGDRVATAFRLLDARFRRHDNLSFAQIGPHQNPDQEKPMCRNIRTLFNFEPPATEEEIHAAALQFVRKLSGFNAPSRANAAAFDRAVDEVSEAACRLLASMAATRPPRDREAEAVKARARARARFA